jgi:hypothetical protein
MVKLAQIKHRHKLAFCGNLEGEYGGNYPLYWCLDCGILVETFPTGNCAVMTPEFTRDIATQSRGVEFVPKTKIIARKTCLGRTYNELAARSSNPPVLAKLLQLKGSPHD